MRWPAASPRAESGIGSVSEGSLHHFLKFYFEPDADLHEVGVGRYFADIRNEDGILEIQTRALYRLKPKLDAFLPLDAVTVVYPVAAVKRLSWLDPDTGEKTRPRRSPKKGTRYDCIRELYALRDYLTRDGFRLCLVFLELEEIRLKNGWGRGGKRGSERMDRLPLGLVRRRVLQRAGRLRPVSARICAVLVFTAAEFAAAARVTPMIAGMTVNLLRAPAFGAGRQAGRALLYKKK